MKHLYSDNLITIFEISIKNETDDLTILVLKKIKEYANYNYQWRGFYDQN